MQTNVEILAGLKRRLKVILPAEVFSAQNDKSIKKIATKAKIDGFRKGKVPKDVLMNRFGNDILEETVNYLIGSSLREAYEKESIMPVSQPVIEALQAELAKPFEYTAEFEVAPVIDVVHFDDVAIEKMDAHVDAAAVDAAITNMAKQFGGFKLKEGVCDQGDRITIDFEGSIDGVLFEGGQAKAHTFTLGAGEMIPGFEDGIIGMQLGEEKTIEVVFPENYHADLSGKQAQFKIKLTKIEEPESAPIDDALAKRIGIANGGVTELREEVTKALNIELTKKLRDDIHKKVFDKLLELNPIEVPESLVHEEIHYLMGDAKKRFQEMTGQKEAPDFPHDMFKEQAERRVRTSYLIVKLVEQNDLKPDAADIRKLAEEMAVSYENPDQVRDYFLSDKKYYRNLENMVIENAVVSLLLDKAKVTVIEKPYDEVVVKR